MATTYGYERLEDGKIRTAPLNDMNGKITGQCIYGLRAWLDEHPAERKALGYVKHIRHDARDIEFNHQTQYIVTATRQVDEWTIEDELHVMDKSEEMMRLEELAGRIGYMDDGIHFYGGEFIE